MTSIKKYKFFKKLVDKCCKLSIIGNVERNGRFKNEFDKTQFKIYKKVLTTLGACVNIYEH